MAVATETSSIQYLGNAVTTVFPTTYKFGASTDLVVKKALAASPTAFVVQTLGVDYTVTGAGLDAGGNVTMTVAPANNDVLVIERTVPITQPVNFVTQGSFSPLTHDNEFDRLTFICQQLARRVAVLEGASAIGAGNAIAGNGLALRGDGKTLDVVPGNGVAVAATVALGFDATNPADISDAGPAPGVANPPAHRDHVHAHGNRGGGALHSVAVSAGANGFQTGTDKQRQDALWARQVIAGTGLTGGGDLSADRTLNVIANADGSIVANADDVQVGVLATDAQHGNRGGGAIHAAVVAAGANGFMLGTDKSKLDKMTAAFAGAVQTTQSPVTVLVAYTPSADSVTMVKVMVTGRKTDGTQGAGYLLLATVRRVGAGNPVLVGAVVQSVVQEDNAAWDATLAVSGTDVQVKVTGVDATTINWQANGLACAVS